MDFQNLKSLFTVGFIWWFLCAALVVCTVSAQTEEPEWWKTTTFYQVYPRSFKDTNADGIGDLTGILMKLDHFVDLAIGGVWLSPIFKSPMKDFGYDVSDFRDIDPIFGTMDDFDALVQGCKDRGLKLVLDFVPNHSSDEHEWFQKSILREEPYTDYYVWKDPSSINASGSPLPPNNWLSVFGGSAWEYNEEREQFYLHQFVAGQPDLNFRNPAVVEEMKNVLRFWMDKGVDGFRLDAVPHLMEDPNFPDEPLSNDDEFTPDQWGYLSHIYTTDLPELYDIIYQFRSVVDEYESLRPMVMMVEAYTSLDNTMKYYGDATRKGAHFPFNFQFIVNVNNDTNAVQLKEIIDTWQNALPEGAWSNWVIGNHDRTRVASRFGRDFGLAAIILGQLLPGTAITYNGEEINMEDTWISWEDTVDPQGCQAGPEFYEKFTRDPVRTPFQWDNSTYAGFTSVNSNKPWLPVNENYVDLNLAEQKEAEMSPYWVYKMLIRARRVFPALKTNGRFVTTTLGDSVLAVARAMPAGVESDLNCLVLVNTGHDIATVDASTVDTIPSTIMFYTGSLDAEYAHAQNISATAVNVPARGAVVFVYASGIGATTASAMLVVLLALLQVAFNQN